MDSSEHDWRTPRSIRRPADLREVLRAIARAVEAGELRQVELCEPWMSPPLDEVPVDGPWPDVLCLRLEDPRTGERWEVTAETYHGSGGSWGRVH